MLLLNRVFGSVILHVSENVAQMMGFQFKESMPMKEARAAIPNNGNTLFSQCSTKPLGHQDYPPSCKDWPSANSLLSQAHEVAP
jgi:hypothetical protein